MFQQLSEFGAVTLPILRRFRESQARNLAAGSQQECLPPARRPLHAESSLLPEW